ncbi:78R [Yaba monkey tumor virus]|uniref:78R n=1 Tax=Yaba monkey tumor virus (strain VR587) TaxID=928314 RepID=Q6TUT7_YMTV5|nr:78R [Yaba monkey tumor virus]AAR07434.1 78R [Yaba monkey tumor virus]
MDDKLKTISLTFFSGELSPVDIVAIKLFLLNKRPIETVFSIDGKNNFVLDFNYGSFLASNYTNINLKRLQRDEYIVYSSDIAKELTLYDIICDNVQDYINNSSKLKRVVKIYKCKKQNIKIKEARKSLKIATKRGVDYDYIKDSCVLNSR